MFHDRNTLHVLVPYYKNSYKCDLIKLVVESYEVDGTTITYEKEVTLANNALEEIDFVIEKVSISSNGN